MGRKGASPAEQTISPADAPERGVLSSRATTRTLGSSCVGIARVNVSGLRTNGPILRTDRFRCVAQPLPRPSKSLALVCGEVVHPVCDRHHKQSGVINPSVATGYSQKGIDGRLRSNVMMHGASGSAAERSYATADGVVERDIIRAAAICVRTREY
jgi:hypothetical protein